jgi:(p)ppGpp synthase/HD superfamily hydrolase
MLEERARAFATEAHARIDHRRKYTGDPYILHPEAVAAIVRSVPHDEAMIAAAWLHDTVEDTGVLLSDVVREFGEDVGTIVEQLTDVSKPSDGNRKVRKAIDRRHTARACPRAKTVKLADLIDNAGSILEGDRDFARVYLEEKRLLLQVLREGDATLWARANEIVIVGQRSLARSGAGH